MATCPRNHAFLRPTLDFLFYSERDHIRKRVFAANVPLCVWCQESVGDWRSDNPFTADHIVNRHAGGMYSEENLTLACKACNSDRGGLSVLQYMHKRALRDDERRAAQGDSLAA